MNNPPGKRHYTMFEANETKLYQAYEKKDRPKTISYVDDNFICSGSG